MNTFVDHFRASMYISCNNPDKAELLKQSSLALRTAYCGLHSNHGTHKIDTELVSRIITNLKQGKAMDIDGLTAKHNFVIQFYL